MGLISVIFALIAESFISNLSGLRRFDYLPRYVSWLRVKLPTFSFQNGSVTLVIVVAGVLFVFWLFSIVLSYVLSDMLGNVFVLFEFLFGIVVLIFMIGPRGIEKDVQQICEAFESKNYDDANRYATKLKNQEISEPPMQLAQTMKEIVLLQANTSLLGVFFWFVLLGPVGAILFRLTCLIKENHMNENDDFAQASRDLYRIMIWLPARICVLSYAIAGSFVETMSYWNGVSDLWLRDSEEFIVISGIGSLRYEHRTVDEDDDSEPDITGIKQALALVKRAIIVWVVLLGLLTITGWLV